MLILWLPKEVAMKAADIPHRCTPVRDAVPNGARRLDSPLPHGTAARLWPAPASSALPGIAALTSPGN
jgi:hypothetical protein